MFVVVIYLFLAKYAKQVFLLSLSMLQKYSSHTKIWSSGLTKEEMEKLL